jgi:hypothetical protein
MWRLSIVKAEGRAMAESLRNHPEDVEMEVAFQREKKTERKMKMAEKRRLKAEVVANVRTVFCVDDISIKLEFYVCVHEYVSFIRTHLIGF